MKPDLSPRCRARLFAFVLGLACAAPLLAAPLPLHGRWLPDEPEAGRAVLTIKEATLSWRGRNPPAPACAQDYVLIKERPGTVYTDGRGTKFVAGSPGSIPTYLMTLGAGTCGTPGEQVRVRFPLIYDINHIEFIEYAAGRPVNARRLHRKK